MNECILDLVARPGGERQVQGLLLAALRHPQGEAFVKSLAAAAGRGKLRFVKADEEVVDGGMRHDIVLTSVRRRECRIELKLWSGFTPAQRQALRRGTSGLSAVVVPDSREAEFRRELRELVRDGERPRVLTWSRVEESSTGTACEYLLRGLSQFANGEEHLQPDEVTKLIKAYQRQDANYWVPLVRFLRSVSDRLTSGKNRVTVGSAGDTRTPPMGWYGRQLHLSRRGPGRPRMWVWMGLCWPTSNIKKWKWVLHPGDDEDFGRSGPPGEFPRWLRENADIDGWVLWRRQDGPRDAGQIAMAIEERVGQLLEE